MGRGSNTQAKRRREAERERKKREKQERARQRRAEGGGGIEIASVEDIQTAAVNATVEGVLADGTILSGEDQSAASGPPCRLFVGGLSWETTAGDLRKTFADIGEVVDAVIVMDRDTGDSRGFGFVTMVDRKVATKAMRELGGFELNGRSLRVDMATDR
ncbi:RNA recognition motif protein [Enhygromyxa salina]|uniref:RNA recognition motif protein n=1 Tax=Enhygromyxa salina TaxID=215803 RepID=A0A2S9XXR4_9BACT|nr:RNA-binding protein [Enhygromyxa salina]PRP97658.1 RNA recognition motif protein [Enhygromyxa salina]